MKPYTRAEALDDEAAALAAGDMAGALRAADRLDRMEPHPPATVLGAALWYASIGLRVFPVVHGGKAPLPRTRGVLDATSDEALVRRMFGSKPVNIGLATGYLLDVLDFDGPGSHEAWSKEFPPVRPGDPPTGDIAWTEAGVTVLASVSTPRAGGLHVYVPASNHGNRGGMLPHVDYRGRGGYVVAPPSWTPEGRYVFARSLDPDKMHRHAVGGSRHGR